jgi:DNA repair protein SbcC/Rad50
MSFRLKTLSVEDFRSIRGPVSVSLDAPVVLIHGPNGTGKTSLLSAIEFALTGAVPSLQRMDPNYINYLPHKDATNGRGKIRLEVSGLPITNECEIVVDGKNVPPTPLLSAELAKFFNERCFLPQSTLGRLLELYQHQEKKADTPLTLFVKDLLGLDHFDAVIQGLHTAGDVRRTRETVPEYWFAREEIPELEKTVAEREEQETILNTQVKNSELRANELLGVLSPPQTFESANVQDLRSALNSSELSALARSRRDLIALDEQWQKSTSDLEAMNIGALERQDHTVQEALTSWRSSAGRLLAQYLLELQSFFPSLPAIEDDGVLPAHKQASDAVARELNRLNEVFDREDLDAQRSVTLAESVEQGNLRLKLLDTEIAQIAPANETLAQLLAQIAPFVQSNKCPVCERDYTEFSPIPLQAMLSEKISQLVESSGRLQAIVADKSTTTAAISTATRELQGLTARRLPSPQLDEIKTRRARLTELRGHLQSLGVAVEYGADLERQAAAAARQLGDFRSKEHVAATLRTNLDNLARSLSQPMLEKSEPSSSGIERLRNYIEANERRLSAQNANRTEAISVLEQLTDQRKRLGSVHSELQTKRARLLLLYVAKEEADRRMGIAKGLIDEARETRAKIVRKVFNEDLNRVWRDLFVRLAPEEPFVPAFALPDSAKANVEAVLETLYRDGGKGGNPRAMLSAGNLNTAALTLFLALHLSVKRELPCLLIDDPVQSMDEVHIAQFAALLRTLSKQKERQIIIAVHEKQLFDYLSLELSPTYMDDRLITIELRKTLEGRTTASWLPKVYEVDQAIAV